MPDLGSAYVNIIPKAPGIEANMKKLLGDGAKGAGDPAGQKAGAGFMAGLKKMVAAAAVGKVLKDAFSAGGDLQQSFGGLDTIYGDAAAAAKKYAAEAALAGISANSYAEQAVSVGAALKQAFGGDTTAAMEAANTAIMDMTDNAAKMGTPLESIQQAYQGFAKQNYTMLDNLKLGYGGTKTEMERLLAAAEALSGVKYDIGNLGDVYDAIHVIQGELGLTGVAAQEAETTLTGSFGAVKASWTNVLAAMTSGESDLNAAMKNLSTSVGNFATVTLKMTGTLIKSIPTLLSGLSKTIMKNAPKLLSSGAALAGQLISGFSVGFPAAVVGVSGFVLDLANNISANAGVFIENGRDLIAQLASGILQAIPTIATTASSLVTSLLLAFTENAQQLFATGSELIAQLVQGIINSLPEVVGSAVQILGELLMAFIVNAPSLIGGGIEIILAVIEGLVNAIPQLIEQVPVIFDRISAEFSSIDWASLGNALIDGIVAGVVAAASRLWEAVKDVVRGALGAGRAEAEVGSPSRLFARELGHWIPPGVAVGIEENLTPVNSAIRKMTGSATAEFQRAKRPGMTVSREQGVNLERLLSAAKEAPVPVNIYLQGDARKFFKVVREENGVRAKATGYNALARA